MPIFRFLGKNSRFWESLTKKKKIKGHFQGKTWIFQEFFFRFGNVDENLRFGPKNVDGLFFGGNPGPISAFSTLNVLRNVHDIIV